MYTQWKLNQDIKEKDAILCSVAAVFTIAKKWKQLSDHQLMNG
jgi:hypothetical protein